MSFAVYGLFNEYDYDVALIDGRLSFIHSQNGFGKSTLMRLISCILTGDLEQMSDVAFARMDLRFDDGTCLIAENQGGEVSVRMQKNDLTEDLSAEEARSVMNTVYISPYRYLVKSGDGYAPALPTYLARLRDGLRAASEGSALPAPRAGAMSGLSDEELERRCRDLKAKLDFMKGAGLEPDMPPGQRFPPGRMDIHERRGHAEDLASSVEGYVGRFYAFAESVVVFLDLANGLFMNKEVFINDGCSLNARMSNGTAVPMGKLSSGEEQMLIMLYRILFDSPAGSLIIIDEPEISLHVSWQQQMGGMLSNLARMRDLQIVVATHSPQIIHDGWDSATELRAGDER